MVSKLEKLLVHLKSTGISISSSLCGPRGARVIDINPHGLKDGMLGAKVTQNLLREWSDGFLVLQEDVFPIGQRCPPQKLGKAIDPWSRSLKYLDTKSSNEPWHFLSRLTDSCRRSALSSHYNDHPFVLPVNKPYGFVQLKDVDYADVNSSIEDRFLRSSLFQVMAAHFFMNEESWKETVAYFCKQRLMWWKRMCNSPANVVLSNPSLDDDSPVESVAEIQYKFDWTDMPLESIAAAGLPCEKQLNYCIEMTSIAEQGLFSLFYDAYQETNEDDETDGPHVVMKLIPKLAPFKAVIAVTDPGCMQQQKLSHRLCRLLKTSDICCLLSGHDNLELTIRLHDGLGTPYVIILDDSTVSRGIVTMRNRDNGVSEFLHIGEVKDILQKLVRSR